MISTIDRGPDGRDWACIDFDKDEIVYDESGERKPFATSDIIFTRGKYAGYKLSEVSDSWYLKFIMEKNPDDYLISYCFTKRLAELK